MESLIDPLSLLFLRENRIDQELVGASHRFDRDALVRAHSVEAQRSYELHGRGRYYAVYHDGESRISEEVGAQSSEMRPIRLKYLTLGAIHKSRVLRGKLCVEPYKALAVASVLEQDDGMAVRIRVYDTTCSSAEEARKMFFMGVSVEVRDPLLMGGLDGSVVLYVSHPSLLKIASPPSGSVEADRALPVVERYRMEGKHKMASGDYSAAVTAYSKCIAELGSHGAEEHHEEFSLHVALSKRAEAFLRSHEYEKALCDANMALDVDSSHVKSIFRRGRALLRLHEYAEAINCFEKLSLMSRTISGQVKEELERARRMNEQSTLGKHCYFKNPLDRDDQESLEDLEFGEYIGSVALRDGRLYATTEIKNGETIIVTNAIAVVDLSSGISTQILVQNCIGVVKSSERIWMQLNALASPAMPRDAMDLFRPNKGWYDSLPSTTKRIVDENLIASFVANHRISMGSPGNWVVGIWLLPSIISHSCTPNATKLRRGKAMFLHAARDIHAEEEITTCYISLVVPDMIMPQKIREKALGFMCRCQRCNFERGEGVRKLLKQIVREHEDVFRNSGSFENVRTFTSQLLRVAVKLEEKLRGRHFSDERTRWIRASFAYDYVIPYLHGVYGSTLPPIETILDAMYATDPSYKLHLDLALDIRGGHLCLEREDLGNPLMVEMLKSRFGRRDGRVYRQVVEQMIGGRRE